MLNGEDSFEDHIKDTLVAGAGLCDENVVRMVVENGPERVSELVALGVNFVKEKDGSLSLGREGGHSKRRVAHAYDLTGREIERALVESVGKSKKVSLYENHMCVDLITEEKLDNVDGVAQKKCVGAYVIDDSGEIKLFLQKWLFFALAVRERFICIRVTLI